jgi:hypothetical protein
MMATTAWSSAALAAIVPADEDQNEAKKNAAAGNDGNETVDHGVLSGSVSNRVRLRAYPNWCPSINDQVARPAEGG